MATRVICDGILFGANCGIPGCLRKGRTHSHDEKDFEMKPYEFPHTKEYQIKPRKTMLKYVISPLVTIALVAGVNFVVPVVKEHNRIEAEKDAAMIASLPPKWRDVVYAVRSTRFEDSSYVTFQRAKAVDQYDLCRCKVSREQVKFIAAQTDNFAAAYTDLIPWIND